MRRVSFSTLLVALSFSVLPARAEPVSQAIIDKAIKAHGGEEKLAKLNAAGTEAKIKGTLHMFGGVAFTLDNFVQMPSKVKNVMSMQINGMNITTIQVINGDKFYMNVNGMNVDSYIDDKMQAEIKEQIYQESVVGLLLLKDKTVQLSPLGEVKVEDKPAVGLRVVSKGHRDVNLYFDKTSGLLVKTEMRTVDLIAKHEQTQEKIYLEYKKFGDLVRPTKIVMKQDGKDFMEMELAEVKIVDKFPADTFAKP